MNSMMHRAIGLCRRTVLLLLCVAATLTATAQTVEYFWNTDPGIGKAAKLSAASAADGTAVCTIDASRLSVGVNVLGMRAAVKGRWTHTTYRYIYMAGGTQTAEYFWNTDPGIGKATPLTLTAAGGGEMTSEISCDGLPAGVNILGIRTNSSGRWTQTKTYAIVTLLPGNYRLEYFCDTDPGPGRATPLDASRIDEGGMVNVELLAEGLTPGPHTIGFRAWAGMGWSTTVTATVMVPPANGRMVTAAEYFWGADPGYGKGTPIPLPQNSASDVFNIDSLVLDFPAEAADEYVLNFRARGVKGWGTTVTKVIPHLYVKELTLATKALTLLPDSTARLAATVTPADAFNATLLWTSSDPSVATVDDTGLVTAQADGTAEITARTTDGSDISAACIVTVFTPPLGDANANGVVNIADAVNIANHAVGNVPENFYRPAADVNRDGSITLSDASATVTLILNQPATVTAAAKVRALARAKAETPPGDALVLDNYVAGGISTVGVTLPNTQTYAALQADVTLPEGMTLEAVKTGKRAARHSLATKQVDERTVRITLFHAGSHPFADGDEPLLELVVKASATARGSIAADNVIAADAMAHEYVLDARGGHSDGTTAIDLSGGNDISIKATADGVTVYNAKGRTVGIYTADGMMVSRFEAESDAENRKLLPGAYVVTAGEKAAKVMVKQ